MVSLALVAIGCAREQIDQARADAASVAREAAERARLAAERAADAAAERGDSLARTADRKLGDLDVPGWAERLHAEAREADERFVASHRPDPEVVAEVGAMLHQQIMGLVEESGDGERTAQARRVLAALCERVPGPFTVTVIDSSVVNAFIHCGGYVYVTSALMETDPSDDELAFILGHELAHDRLDHSLRTLAYAEYVRQALAAAAGHGTAAAADALERALGVRLAHREQVAAGAAEAAGGVADALTPAASILYQAVALGYSEDLEYEADAHGLQMAVAAGFAPDVAGAPLSGVLGGDEAEPPAAPTGTSFARAMGALQGHFASHPPTPARIALLEQLAGASGGGPRR